MQRFLTSVDLTKNELRQAAVHNLASAPGTPALGQIYYDTVVGSIHVKDATGFKKMLLSGQVVNADIDAGAAIAYSKLNLSSSIVNSDVAAGAAIAYSKLNLSASIVNADIAAGAAITYAKLSLAASIVSGDIAASLKPSGSAADGTEALRALGSTAGTAMPGVSGLDDIAGANASTGSITASSQKITNLADPTVASDAANKAYVDLISTGYNGAYQPVRLVTVAALPANTRTGNVLTADANGALSVDGVAVDNGDRVLINNEVTSANNFLYLVTDKGSAGAPFILTRSTDADVSGEIISGKLIPVAAGTQADSVWILGTDGSITLNTTGLSSVKLYTIADLVAGAGLTKTGQTVDAVGTANRITVNANDIDISAAYVGQASITTLGTIATGVWNGTDIAVADGGTGASTIAGAKTNLGFTTKFSQDIGNGAATSFAVTHSLGTRDVVVEVFDNSTFDRVFVDVVHTSTSVVTVDFTSAPATNAYRVVVVG